MSSRRTLSLLRLWVLAWFVTSIGVSVASPLIHPQSIEIICSGSGAIKWLVQTDEGAVEMGTASMDCPLCATASGAPPSSATWTPPTPDPLAHAVHPVEAARIAAATAPPLPARGPPHSL